MIPACIVNIINGLSITHYQLTPWKAPTTILNQVSWSKPKSNQVERKLNLLFKVMLGRRPTVVFKIVLPICEIDEAFEISVRLYIANQILPLIISLLV